MGLPATCPPPASHMGWLAVSKECTCLSCGLLVPPGMALTKSTPGPSKAVPGIAKSWPNACVHCKVRVVLGHVPVHLHHTYICKCPQ